MSLQKALRYVFNIEINVKYDHFDTSFVVDYSLKSHRCFHHFGLNALFVNYTNLL